MFQWKDKNGQIRFNNNDMLFIRDTLNIGTHKNWNKKVGKDIIYKC